MKALPGRFHVKANASWREFQDYRWGENRSVEGDDSLDYNVLGGAGGEIILMTRATRKKDKSASTLHSWESCNYRNSSQVT